jgi:hypothetical protein
MKGSRIISDVEICRCTMKRIILFLVTISFVTLSAGVPLSAHDERGLTVKQKKGTTAERRKADDKRRLSLRMNSADTFAEVREQKVYVFMVGNDKYQRRSGFGELRQCYNDVILLRQIFIHCLKVNPKRIFSYRDLSLNAFMNRFNDFIDKLDENSLVVFTYSGHGDEDGSLVFVDGGRLRSNVLKNLINSFGNDTVLLIDACYSGNNEGPIEVFKGKKRVGFKPNSLRIYASLAHLTAKEIAYSNVFFQSVRPFYRDVLKIHAIEGNGYFTAMIGLFFASYKLKEDENISFKDLVSYITNRGKQYVEYLAARGKKERNQSMLNESSIRLNQQPKIHPIGEEVPFDDENHRFMLVQDPILPPWPRNDFYSFGIGFSANFPMGTMSGSMEMGYMPLLFINYNLNSGWGILGLGITTGASMTETKESVPYQYRLLTVPVAANVKYYTKLKIPLFFMIDVNIGYAFSRLEYQESYPDRENQTASTPFFITGFGIGYNLHTNLSAVLSMNYVRFYFENGAYSGVAPGLSLIFKF